MFEVPGGTAPRSGGPQDPERAAFINGIATAVPDHDVHRSFVAWAGRQITDPRRRALFARMAERAGIDHRWSVLRPTADGGSPVGFGGFYSGDSPATSERMRLYAETAPKLALDAIANLSGDIPLDGVTHLVVASCTGFVAPGIDQIIADQLGLRSGIERTLVGFMGCYAAVAALRLSRHIVRSEPDARVLVVTAELSTLHLQFHTELEPLLAMLQFGDGAAAAMVSSDPFGLAMSRPFSVALADTAGLIRWNIGDNGFAMHLSGEVPGRIAAALQDDQVRAVILGEMEVHDIALWAVHAGGRSIIDAVQRALHLPDQALDASTAVLADYGNMSSSTLMFVLALLMERRSEGKGLALAFGPGLAAEGFQFEAIP